MLSVFKRFFSKSEDHSPEVNLPKNEEAIFNLKFKDIVIGTLQCKNGQWIFKYTEGFKNISDKYSPIAGFPDVNKVYINDTLWPFFQTRIPGLKQPAIIEIMEKEHIDKNNEFQLLKYFGKKTINNPYELDTV